MASRTVLSALAAASLAGTALSASATPARAFAPCGLPVPRVASAAAAATGQVSITGAGFGHGVGMSQYGALGMARAGASAGAILRHYYTGVQVAPYRDNIDVRVNVVHAATSVTLGSTARATGGGGLRLVPDGVKPLSLAARDTVTLRPSSGRVSVTVTRSGRTGTPFLTSALTVTWPGTRLLAGSATTADVTSTTGSSRKARSYRWGSLRVTPVGSALDAVAAVGLHSEYVRGVAEMPSSWPPAALQAQAVAARNYALVATASAPKASCGGCHLWDSTRSQVYTGWAKESESSGSTRWGDRWVAAVQATQTSTTASLAVLYKGRPVTTYYASSTGGRTRDSGDVWGTSLPYLASVTDPWSVDPSINPRYARWTRSVPVPTLLRLFSLPDLASVKVTSRDAAGAAKVVTATSSTGIRHTVSGNSITNALGLPGAWITGLSVPRPAGRSDITPGPLRRDTIGRSGHTS